MEEELWRPKCKQDVVDLLMKVQTGHASCRFAADVLFPELNPGNDCNRRYAEMLKREQ